MHKLHSTRVLILHVNAMKSNQFLSSHGTSLVFQAEDSACTANMQLIEHFSLRTVTRMVDDDRKRIIVLFGGIFS